MKTPQEEANAALSGASQFCHLTAAARQYKYPLCWSGSAYCHHPCGIIDGTIKFTNDWHTSDSCSIQITDGSGWSGNYSRNSFGHGNPEPQPIDGHSVTVWSSGKWRSEEFRERLESKCLSILEKAAAFVATKSAAEVAENERKQVEITERRRLIEEAALAKIGCLPHPSDSQA